MRPKKSLKTIALPVLSLLVFCASPLLCPAQAVRVKAEDDVARQILTEVARLNRLLPSLGFPAEEAAGYANQIAQIEKAVQEGRLLSGVQLLEQVEPFLAAVEYQRSKRAVEQGGMEAFEREWLRLGEELKEKERPFAVKPARRLPMAVQAIIERCLTQVQPHYQSGRLYGQNTTISAGLFYLGTSLAHLQFAVFCQGLRFPAAGIPLPPHSPGPELGKLEKEILQAYRNADAATQQGTFNRINSALKTAQDLQQERRFRGALLQYLEVCRLLGTIASMDDAPPSRNALKKQADSLRARLLAGNTDHSIARLYLEMAQATLDAPEPDARELRRAGAILNRVIPSYFDYLARTNK